MNVAFKDRINPLKVRRHLFFMCAIVLWCSLASVAKTPKSKAKKEPIVGDRVAKAIAFEGELWLRGVTSTGKGGSGGLISLNVADGSKSVHYKNGVIDIEKAGGELWVLRHASADGNALAVSILSNNTFKDLPKFEISNKDGAIALLDNSGVPVVLSRQNIRILSADRQQWRTVTLKGALRWGVQVAAASPRQGDSIYVGFNKGEWGGGLQRVNIRTGVVTDVERRDTKGLCEGPLNSDCDPVTSVIADSQNADCVLTSIGLVHMGFSHGGILRICGEKVTPVWQKPGKGGWDAKRDVTEAVFGLAPAADGGAWAITQRALYRLSADMKDRKDMELPKLREVSGIYLSTEVPGAIIVRTDLNWAVSVSGYTPLVVPLESQNK